MYLGENMTDQIEYNRSVIEEFRASGGKPGGRLEHMPILLLTTIGAKSGQPRVAPLGYLTDGDRLLIFASDLGAQRHPAWYHNLVAHPEVTVEVGGETFQAIASIAEGAEREQLWAKALLSFPFIDDHQAQTTRQIPVILLTRKQS
jgi:deazaflavin-dependent oxidoreductase (nitroreductase family)